MKKRFWLLLSCMILITAAVSAQSTRRLQGTIKDDKGPLEGATVTVPTTKANTITDANGRFSIPFPGAAAYIEISMIGFETRRQLVYPGDTAIAVTMAASARSLNDVVVVGYGSVKRKDLTGSVGHVSIDDLNKAPVKSFDEALAGRVAGVQVSSTEGQPGSGIAIIIRGNNSITQSNSPLYVIDGFPVEDPNNNILNPDDIESIDVLKDASAAAIYGARAANGVIIITTRRGKEGDAVVRYSGYYGVQENIKTIPLMNPYDFVKLQSDIGVSDLNQTYLANGVTLDDYKKVQGIDWQSKLYRRAPMQSHTVSVTGGTPKTKYAISGQVLNQQGIIINSSFKRYQGKMSLDQTVSTRLKVGVNVIYTNTQTTGTQPSSMSGSSMNNLQYGTWGYRPVSPLDPSKTLGDDFEDDLVDDLVAPGTDYRMNPIVVAQNEYRLRNINNIFANAYMEYGIIKNLKLRVTAGILSTIQRNDAFNNSKTRSGNPNNIYGVNGSVNYYETSNWVNENMLTYTKTFNKVHRFMAQADFSTQANRYKYYGMSAQHLPNESLGLNGLSQGIAQPVSSGLAEWSLVSGVSRIEYGYNDKYLLTASFRADGSSKFRDKNRWGYFPSGALAWRISNEPFMKNFSFLSDAKARVSWGMTGNNRVSEYATYATLDLPIANYYSFSNTLMQGAIPTSLASEDLKWETTEQTDVGLDLAFLKQKITFTVDYYKKSTRDLLLNANLPPTTGYSSAYKNIGKVSNQGLEFSLSTVNIEKKDFGWSTSFNISFNRNKVVALTQNQESMTSAMSWDSWYSAVPLYIAKLGQPMGQMYGYIWDGVYQYDDFDKLANGSYVLKSNITTNGNTRASIKPGDVKYRDLNNDKAVDDYDRTVIGRGYPIHFGGFSNNFRYKGFDLNIFFQWSYGNDIINANRLNFETGNKSYLNQFASFNDRWTPEHTNTTMPRAGGQYGYVYSTRVVEDGSYLRLKTAQLGYNVSAGLIKKLKIKACRFYVSGQNLYTWTKYSGSDPETAVGYTALTPGFDYSAYPRARTVTFGASISL